MKEITTQTVSKGRHRVVRERACVLYDRNTGAIRHIQHVIVMEGGYNPDDHQIEAMCRRAITKRGGAHDALDTLHLDREALKPFKVYRVDPERRVLLEREHQRRWPDARVLTKSQCRSGLQIAEREATLGD